MGNVKSGKYIIHTIAILTSRFFDTVMEDATGQVLEASKKETNEGQTQQWIITSERAASGSSAKYIYTIQNEQSKRYLYATGLGVVVTLKTPFYWNVIVGDRGIHQIWCELGGDDYFITWGYGPGYLLALVKSTDIYDAAAQSWQLQDVD